MTYYFVQSKKDGQTPETIGHSQDEETDEIFYKFADRAKAKKFLNAEKEAAPDLKYRLVKIIERIEQGKWE